MGGISDALSIGSSLFGSGGGGSDSSGSSQGSSASGYAALPPQAQAAYNNYFNLVNNIGSQTPLPTPNLPNTYYNADPNSPFASQGMLNLQQQNPNTPMNPTSFTEPMNQYQQSALGQYGSPNFSQQAMQQYMNPYQQQVQNTTMQQMQRQHDMQQSNITDQMNSSNPRILGNSALGTQYALNNQLSNQDMASATANLGYQGYNSAMDLRNQTLNNMYNAGNAVQAQNQQLLNMANPITRNQMISQLGSSQYQTQPNYMQAQALAPLFSAFPQSSMSQNSSQNQSQMTGATPVLGMGQALAPSGFERIAGLFL